MTVPGTSAGRSSARAPGSSSREALDAYYRDADSWAHDRTAELARSRRVAWIAAGVIACVALAEALALVALTPLKTVVPYTLLVDRQTGFVQALQPLDPARVAPDTALTQSFLVQYVIARESFDVDALQANYRRVVGWSAGTARARYIAGVQASNPDSPLARLPRSSVIETRVKSVTPLGGNTAQVRFDTQRQDVGGRSLPARAWVAVIRYRYVGEPMDLEARFVNPLGFTVERYALSVEALPAVAAPEAATPDPAPLLATPSPLQNMVVQTPRAQPTRNP